MENFARRLPGEAADARREVIAIVDVDEGRADSPCAGEIGRRGHGACGATLASFHSGRQRVEGEVEVGQAVVLFRIGGEVLIAHAVIQREVGAYAPIVLHEEIPYVCAEVVLEVAGLDDRLLRQAKKEIGKVGAGVLCAGGGGGRRNRRNKLACAPTGKGIAAEHVGAGERIQVDAAYVEAEVDIVPSMVPLGGLGEGDGLVDLVGRFRVAEAGELREGDAGDAVVQGIVSCVSKVVLVAKGEPGWAVCGAGMLAGLVRPVK